MYRHITRYTSREHAIFDISSPKQHGRGNRNTFTPTQDSSAQDAEQAHFQYIAAVPRIGIGMDSSITPLRHQGLSLVQTTDFFYPLVDDPYDGEYFHRARRCGTNDTTRVQGFSRGSWDYGYWRTKQLSAPGLLIGGVATSVCQLNEYIMPDNAVLVTSWC
ncbi:hypothetical protein ScPMuIL_009217 [Solemya velum]